MVNDILHDKDISLAEILCGINKGLIKLRHMLNRQWRKLFGMVLKGLLHRIDLVKEVRDKLLSLIPESLKQELLESIDVELSCQILESGS